MLHSHRRPVQVVFVVLTALATLFVTALPSPAAEPGTTATPADAATDWLSTELQAKGGMLTISFGGPDEFADQGLTIDAVLGLLAAGKADDSADRNCTDQARLCHHRVALLRRPTALRTAGCTPTRSADQPKSHFGASAGAPDSDGRLCR